MEKTIGQKLVELRRNKGISQQQLSEILNVSRQTISKWENDMSLPDIELLMKLCEFYEITINQLLSDNDDDIKSTYEQLQQVLLNMQKQSKRKNIFNVLLICISIFSLCVSLMLKSQVDGLAPEKDTYLYYRSEPINQILEDSELIMKSHENKMGMVVDLSNLTAALNYRFCFKESTENMKVSLEFRYQNKYAAWESFILPLERENENTFILNKKVPLQNYVDAILVVDDGEGRIKRENIGRNGNCCYLNYVMKNIVNFYIPVGSDGQLDLDKIVYNPTTLYAADRFVYHGKLDCKGTVNLYIQDTKGEYNHYEYAGESVNLSEKTEINLDQPLPLDKELMVHIDIDFEDERFDYHMISFGFSVNLYEMKTFQIQQQSEPFEIYAPKNNISYSY